MSAPRLVVGLHDCEIVSRLDVPIVTIIKYFRSKFNVSSHI